MKRLVLFGGLLGMTGGLFAQTDASAMLKQIAALQVYIADAEKGYKIVEDGVHTIGEIKKGEFNLHSLFFSSLQAVSPEVKGMAEVAEIIALQVSIVNQFSGSLAAYRKSGQLSGDQVAYISKVYNGLVSAGLKDIDALTSLLTDGDLAMDDGERMKRIQAIDGDMRDQWVFTQAFTGEADLLSVQQSRDLGDLQTIGALYGF